MEFVVELLEALQFLFEFVNWPDQDGYSEVVGSFALFEATAWDDDDSCVFEDFHAVEQVWFALRDFDDLIGELD